MKRACATFAWLLSVAMVCAFLSSAVTAATVTNNYTITTTDASQQGWKNAECGSLVYGKPSAKAGLSTYWLGAKGSPGPKPVGNYWMQPGQDGTTLSSPRPGQTWLGTNRYTSLIPKLSSITTLKYWAIVDYRGCDWKLTPGAPTGAGVAPEYTTDWISSQPPQIELHILTDGADPTSKGVLIYRPWDNAIEGNPGYGPMDGSLCRQWKEYDALQGYWLFVDVAQSTPEMPEPVQAMFTWADVVSIFPDSVLMTPPLPTGTVGTPNLFPVFGTSEAPTGASFNFVMGARRDGNGYFPTSHRVWYKESWNAQAAIDYVTIGYNNGTDTVTDVYDFQATYAQTNIVQALSIKSILAAGNVYAPLPRNRTWVEPPAKPAGWWGNGPITLALANPIQQVGNFNYHSIGTAKYGALFCIFGWVSDCDGDFFKLDDGSGKMDCYCPNRTTSPVADGKYVRLVGTIFGNDPYEWYYNWFNCVTWNTDPAKRVYSHLWPWRFDTYPWNVTVLKEP